jgi:hypothetical protein
LNIVIRCAARLPAQRLQQPNRKNENMTADSSKWSSISRTVFFAFCLIAAALIFYEHTLHVLGIFPYLLLLACPLMHLFMHQGHGHRHGQGPANPSPPAETKGGPDHA